jgi:hypothetical protein
MAQKGAESRFASVQLGAEVAGHGIVLARLARTKEGNR